MPFQTSRPRMPVWITGQPEVICNMDRIGPVIAEPNLASIVVLVVGQFRSLYRHRNQSLKHEFLDPPAVLNL
jgi:hypothetical protein